MNELCESAGLTIKATRPTLQKRLENRKNELQAQLDEVNGIIESLKANPEIGKIIDGLARASIY